MNGHFLKIQNFNLPMYECALDDRNVTFFFVQLVATLHKGALQDIRLPLFYFANCQPSILLVHTFGRSDHMASFKTFGHPSLWYAFEPLV